MQISDILLSISGGVRNTNKSPQAYGIRKWRWSGRFIWINSVLDIFANVFIHCLSWTTVPGFIIWTLAVITDLFLRIKLDTIWSHSRVMSIMLMREGKSKRLKLNPVSCGKEVVFIPFKTTGKKRLIKDQMFKVQLWWSTLWLLFRRLGPNGIIEEIWRSKRFFCFGQTQTCGFLQLMMMKSIYLSIWKALKGFINIKAGTIKAVHTLFIFGLKLANFDTENMYLYIRQNINGLVRFDHSSVNSAEPPRQPS